MSQIIWIPFNPVTTRLLYFHVEVKKIDKGIVWDSELYICDSLRDLTSYVRFVHLYIYHLYKNAHVILRKVTRFGNFVMDSLLSLLLYS